MEPLTARHVLGLVVEEAEVLHARVLLAAALAGGTEAGSGNGNNGAEAGGNGGGGGAGSAAAAAPNGAGAAGAQYQRLAAVAEKLLAEWQCVIHSLTCKKPRLACCQCIHSNLLDVL